MAKMTSKNLKMFEYWGMRINLTPDFISGETNEKFFYFFKQQKLFHFPMKQISSIYYVEWANPKKKDLIVILILIVVGIPTSLIGIWVPLLLLAWFLIWKKTKKTVSIEVFSWSQSLLLPIPSTAADKVKEELKIFANDVLEEIAKEGGK